MSNNPFAGRFPKSCVLIARCSRLIEMALGFRCFAWLGRGSFLRRFRDIFLLIAGEIRGSI